MDTVSKSCLVMRPHFNVLANRCAMRTLLCDAGFVIVREEERIITGDAETSYFIGKNYKVGDPSECAIFVVARENAVPTLWSLIADNNISDDDVVIPGDDNNAWLIISALFPRMKRDLIPTQEHSAEFLDRELKMLLVKGLTELAKTKPKNPQVALAEWLLENNPHRSAPKPAADSK